MEKYFHLFYMFINLRSDCEETVNYGMHFIRVNTGAFWVFLNRVERILFCPPLEWSLAIFPF